MNLLQRIKDKYFTVSAKYTLRILLAYKDLLRAHFPPVFRWYVHFFMTSQQKAARLLRKK